MSKRKNFNNTYKKLVADDEDLVGMIAYGLYKRSKVEYCTVTSDQNGHIDESALSTFYKTQNTDAQLKSYRNEATNLVANLSEQLLVQKRNSLFEYFQKSVKSDLENHLSLIKGYFDNFSTKITENSKFSWRDFWIGVIGNLVASLLSIIIAFFVWWSVSATRDRDESKDKAAEIITGKNLKSDSSIKIDSTLNN